jgi:tetratricopeptide (TPR) repeat protein
MNRKRCNVLFVFTILLLFFGAQLVAGSTTAVQEKKQVVGSEKSALSLEELDILMQEKTIENCEKAIKGYEQLLKKEPENYKFLNKIAKAYITIIDIKTSAMIEEKDEFKPVLEKYGEIANDYAHKAYKINPNDKEVVAVCLVAYGYYSSSFGIIKAIFKGAAGHYKDLCNQLIKLDEKHSGALGYRALGKLYYLAPWPVGSTKKALKNFQKAALTDGTVLNSQYYLGLIYFDKDKYDLAKKAFTFVVENPANEHEKHFIDAYKKASQKYLDKIAKIQKKK